ncbi:hypothetical protein IWX49DRAFT_192926 [Phyllosticta citricarpa]|uniref:Uncharacterized protein n=2 Tax=Phyllosticta TaxID=121621 RepID=A0ABR1M607_9PEZI
MAASKTSSYSIVFALVAVAMMAQGVAAEAATATSTTSSTTSASTALTPCPSNCTIFTSSSAASLTGAGFFLLFLIAGAINFSALIFMNKQDEAKYKIQLANAKMQQQV